MQPTVWQSPETGPHTFCMLNKITKPLFIAIAAIGLAAGQQTATPSSPPTKLVAPAHGSIPVAFVMSDDAVMIDFAGPWEVFQDVMIPARGGSMTNQHPFSLYTVSDSKKPIRVSFGMRVIPDYTFDDAPVPKVVVIPAQSGASPKMMAWLRKMATQSDVVMSVCTGAFKLAEAGLLNGKKATTHHSSYARFEHQFPDVSVQRDVRFVQSDPVIFTSGGLSAGIDLALHIVELYFGHDAAEETARSMEYEGRGWIDGVASVKYSVPTAGPHPHPSDGLTTGVLGNWQGSIKIPDGVFHLVVHLWRDDAGKLVGAVDSLDEGINDIGLSQLSFNQPGFAFEIPTLECKYEGKLNPDESAIEGIWSKGSLSAPLVLKRMPKN